MSDPRRLSTSSPKDHKITLVDSFNFSGSRNSFKIIRAKPNPSTVLCSVKSQSSLKNTDSDTKGSSVKSDDEKNVSITEPTKPNYHGVAPSWRKLQKFFVNQVRIKHPSIKSQNACYKQAANYINCWITAGYSCTQLKQMIRISDSNVQQGLESHDAFKRRQWALLNKKRKLLEETISLSFLLDKSIEFFRTEIKTDKVITVEGKPDPYSEQQRRLDTMGNYIEMGFRINCKGTPEETDAALQILNKMVELYESHNGKLT